MSVKKELIIPGTKCIVKFNSNVKSNNSVRMFNVWLKNTPVGILSTTFELSEGVKFEITSNPIKINSQKCRGKVVSITINDDGNTRELETFYGYIRFDAEVLSHSTIAEVE
jgi:hypothetical protein